MGQANSLQNTSQNIAPGQYVITNSQMAMNALHVKSQEQKLLFAFDPDNPAWSASVSTIVDTWLAKFGDKWVEESELLGDTFFAIVATRLVQINRLEKHNVPNKFYSVYRIVE
jgi:hypothetical protein